MTTFDDDEPSPREVAEVARIMLLMSGDDNSEEWERFCELVGADPDELRKHLIKDVPQLQTEAKRQEN